MFSRIKLHKYPESDRTPGLCLQAVESDGMNLEHVPSAVLSNEICLESVKQNGYAFSFIPLDKLSSAMCIAAVEQQPTVLPLVLSAIEKKPSLFSAKLIDQICMSAVTNKPAVIKKIPPQFLNDDLYVAALTKDGSTLEFILKQIPSEKLNPDWYWLALKSSGLSVLEYIPQDLQRQRLNEDDYIELIKSASYIPHNAFAHIPKEKLSFKIMLLAIEKDIEALTRVPENLSTEELNSLYLSAVKIDPRALQYIPLEKRSEEICQIALAGNQFAFQFFPPTLLTYEFCLDKVKNNGWMLQYIPKEVLETAPWAKEIYVAAINDNPQALQFSIPPNILTKNDYLEALKKDISAVKYIPDEILTSEMYVQAVKVDPSIFKKIPSDKMTDAIIIAALEQNPMLLKRVVNKYPEKLTEDMCLIAFSNQLLDSSDVFKIFEIIPTHMRSEAVSLRAVRLNWECLQFVPSTLSNLEILYSEAINLNGLALQFIPESMITKELILRGIRNNDYVINYVPKSMLDETLCRELIELQPGVVKYKPDYFTGAMLIEAIKKNSSILGGLPIERINEAMVLISVSSDGMNLGSVPANLRTEAVCLAALNNNPNALTFVPHEIQTEQMCLDIVKQKGELLKFVSPTLRTLPICIAAMEESVTAFEFVPEQFKESIVDKFTMKNIIAEHYLNYMYIPEKYRNEADKFLANIKYISIIYDRNDHELLDSQLIYTESKKGQAISICGTTNSVGDLDRLFKHLKLVGNNNELQLAYIGHANIGSKDLADVSYKQMAILCKNHPAIKHINLIGCYTAASIKLDDEKKMIRAYAQKAADKLAKEKSIDKEKCGVISSLNRNHTDKIFQNKCMSFCKNNQLSAVYVINKKTSSDASGDSYELIKVTCKNDYKECTVDVRLIPNDQVAHILDKKKTTQFPTAKKANEFIFLRNKPINESELQSFKKINKPVTTIPRFEKNHPKYKKDKATYPFLATFDVSPEQLGSSLAKKLANEIQNTPDITWDITIKGLAKAGHSDTFARDIKVARTHLHIKDYNKPFFKSQKPNIKTKKLEKERGDEAKDMQTGNEEGDSLAKKIRTTVTKHK